MPLVLGAAFHSVLVGLLAALLAAGGYAWSPRCYTIADRCIVVKRLIGSVRIPLSGIREARIATPDDFRDCIRTFGSGGLFGYYGLFRTAKLGTCTWYVTNQSNAVVVVTEAKTLVFSPGDIDGFLAAVRGNAPVAMTQPGAPPRSSRASRDRGTPAGMWAIGGIALLVIPVALFFAFYSPGPPNCTLTPESLTIHDRFYPVTLQAADVDVEAIRLIDLCVDTEWQPTMRTNGFANSYYRSGWYRVASGKTVRVYRTVGTRLVLLPPRSDGAAVLLESSDPEKFVREVRQAWGGGI